MSAWCGPGCPAVSRLMLDILLASSSGSSGHQLALYSGSSSPPRAELNRTRRLQQQQQICRHTVESLQSMCLNQCVSLYLWIFGSFHLFIFASLSFHYRFENVVQQSLMNNTMTYRHASQAATPTYQQLDHLDNPPCCWRPNKRKLVFTDTDSDSHLYVQDCPVSLCRRYKG